MTRENISNFENRNNVSYIKSDNGSESWLTQSRTFADETNKLGATKLNTVETENKHVLFLFDDRDAEVGRYYLGKKLQGKTPAEIAEKKHCLVFFESWNPTTSQWVPCIGESSQENLAAKAVSF